MIIDYKFDAYGCQQADGHCPALCQEKVSSPICENWDPEEGCGCVEIMSDMDG